MAIMDVNKNYNFSLHASSILGSSYKNVKLTSILDYETAIKVANVNLLHKQVYPYLPPGVSNDLTKYTYYHFKDRGKSVVLAEPWIQASTIEVTSGTQTTLLLNNVSNNQLDIVMTQLRLLGISYSVL